MTDDPMPTDDSTDLLHKAAMGDADAVDTLAVEDTTNTTRDDANADTDDVDAASADDAPECPCGDPMSKSLTVDKRPIVDQTMVPIAPVEAGGAYVRTGYVCPNACGGAHDTLRIVLPTGGAASRGSSVPTKSDVVDVLTAAAPRGEYHVRRDADGQTISVHVRNTVDMEGLDDLLRARFNREHDDLHEHDGVYILTPNWSGE